MRAASRQALESSSAQLRSLAAEAPAGVLGETGEQLAAFCSVLRDNPVLHRHLSDPSISQQHRRGVLTDVLAGKVNATTEQLLGHVVSQRWSSRSEMRLGLEQLAQDCQFLVADSEGTTAEVTDELFRFGRVLEGHPELSRLLDDSGVAAATRASLLENLLGARCRPVTLALLTQAMQSGQVSGGLGLAQHAARLAQQAAARRGETLAVVTTAEPLTSAQRQRLADALSRIYGTEVTLQVQLDPEVLGGLVVRIGEEVIDGSILARLHTARSGLVS